MKKIYGFAALAAAMTLASCSNNDEPINGGGNINNAPVSKGYVTVNLATPNGSGTRADDDLDGKYMQGTHDESKVTNALLVTFQGGKAYEVVEFTPKPWYNGSGNVDKVSTGNIIEVAVPQEETTQGEETITTDVMIDEFITILNVPAGDLGIKTAKEDGAAAAYTLDQVRQKLADYSNTTNGIVMSTSAYRRDADAEKGITAKDMYTTEVEGKIFKDLADAAKAENLLTVYVERAVARVDYAFKPKEGSFTATADEDFTINEGMTGTDGEATFSPTITVTGVSIANLPDKTYLVKDIAGFNNGKWPSTTWNMNVPGDFRSHWADCAKLESEVTGNEDFISMDNKSYTDIINDMSNSDLKNIVESYDKGSIYAHENTTKEHTAVIITAVVGDGTDLYRMVVNGKYYSGATNVKTAALGYLENDKYFKSETVDGETHYVSLTANDLKIVQSDDHRYDGYIQFDDSLEGNLYLGSTDADNQMKFTLIQGDGSTDAEKNAAGLAKANDDLKKAEWKSERDGKMLKKYRVYRWNNGKCYYYTDINPEYVDTPGVVRNHIYDLKLTSVAGLGIPVFEPSDVIIPEIPDKVDPKEPDNYFVRATINILNWTYYSQDVNFVTPEGE